MIFRKLSKKEERDFRQHARENYVVGDKLHPDIHHPIWIHECAQMILEDYYDQCSNAGEAFESLNEEE